MVVNGIIETIRNYASADFWLFLAAGILIGLMVGFTPGIGAVSTFALILPFIFRMDPMPALVLLIAIGTTTFNGGAISAILFNVPGETASAATMLDGYPMSQKGEAGRALGAAEMSGGLAHVITACLALAFIPLILPMVMAIRSADMVFVILVGIAFIAVLAGGSMLKGLISGLSGLLISYVGIQISSGVPRFTFGIPYLYEGLELVPVTLGLFALPEMVALASEGSAVAARSRATLKGMADVLRGVKDVFRHWALVIRGVIIGFIIGVVPGIGGSSAGFITYAQARQTSKHPEAFGTGTVEGVIAAESSNNSERAGALLTTLALGVPGSASMALLLGALIILGIVPGPDMLTKHLGLSITLISVIMVAGLLASFGLIAAAPILSRISFIPGSILAPLIITIVVYGAFIFRGETFDFIVLLVFSVIGFLMRRYGYNRAALVLGFVLGNLFEKYLVVAYKLDGPLFFMRPISLGLILLTIAVVAYDPVKRALQRRKGACRA